MKISALGSGLALSCLMAFGVSAQERILVGRAAIVEREATAQYASEAARTIKIAD